MSYYTSVLVPALSHSTQTAQYLGGTDYTGPEAYAANYYSSSDTQTVMYSVINFIGNINIQGTLVDNPSDNDWTTLFSIGPTDTVGARVVNGKFCKIRATVTNFTQGTINDIRVTY